LISGEVFDSSYERGEPTTFAPNQVISGWTEAMQLMVEGDKWELTIPSEMAYGERGKLHHCALHSCLEHVFFLLGVFLTFCDSN
jgi:FKBP-type peptidyl-prolyl cis-trans isomerase FklB